MPDRALFSGARSRICAAAFLAILVAGCESEDQPPPVAPMTGAGGSRTGGTGGGLAAGGGAGGQGSGGQAMGGQGSGGAAGAGGGGGSADAAARGDLGSSGDLASETASAPEAGPSAGGDQLPPQGQAALKAWLAAGHYRAWNCEAEVMNARPRGAHGRNRICSNALLSAHGAGPYPVGAASVKEVYSGDKLSIHAVAVKIKPGIGNDTWYWYEEGYADAVNAPLCIGCHSTVEQNGGHDFVFIQVK